MNKYKLVFAEQPDGPIVSGTIVVRATSPFDALERVERLQAEVVSLTLLVEEQCPTKSEPVTDFNANVGRCSL